MNPKPPQPRPSRSAVLPLMLAAFIVLIPLLYLLALGPLLWAGYRDVISVETCQVIVETVYAPLN